MARNPTAKFSAATAAWRSGYLMTMASAATTTARGAHTALDRRTCHNAVRRRLTQRPRTTEPDNGGKNKNFLGFPSNLFIFFMGKVCTRGGNGPDPQARSQF